MHAFENMAAEQQRNFIFQKVKAILDHSWRNIPFYRELYDRNGLQPGDLKSFDDLCNIPVVTKAMLNECDLEHRSFPGGKRYSANTGGSSGAPLSFYILPSSIGHEWAYMHRIWGKLGFTQKALKLVFAGRNLKTKTVAYDALRNHFAVNIYKPNEEVAQDLRKVLTKNTIRYIHGYPSAIYDFACYCESNDPELAAMLSSQLQGGFLGSEYPVGIYRDKIEAVFGIPTISWYGHTERVVLAWEKNEKFVYCPFQTYGFTEAIEDPETGKTKLAATSYYNTASPFIRYDTGDEITAMKSSAGILEEFRIETGREGDYILDRKERRIPLTGLVFGRHHKIFDKARFVQISQQEPGKAVFLITISKETLPETAYHEYFDLSNIEMDFEFKQIDSPILTRSGKTILNVSKIEKP